MPRYVRYIRAAAYMTTKVHVQQQANAYVHVYMCVRVYMKLYTYYACTYGCVILFICMRIWLFTGMYIYVYIHATPPPPEDPYANPLGKH